jgi:hypothetical protein
MNNQFTKQFNHFVASSGFKPVVANNIPENQKIPQKNEKKSKF